jgi:Cu-Zn family superoxide dismutase
MNNHGPPTAAVRHVGDLGNLVANSYGIATVSLSDSQISLNGENSVIGRSFVIKEMEDDLRAGGDQMGNSGYRFACGIVGIASSTGMPYQ